MDFLSVKRTFRPFKCNFKPAFNDHILKIRNSMTKFKSNKNLGAKYDFWKKSKGVFGNRMEFESGTVL
jgi:hypothetical protein